MVGWRDGRRLLSGGAAATPRSSWCPLGWCPLGGGPLPPGTYLASYLASTCFTWHPLALLGIQLPYLAIFFQMRLIGFVVVSTISSRLVPPK